MGGRLRRTRLPEQPLQRFRLQVPAHHGRIFLHRNGDALKALATSAPRPLSSSRAASATSRVRRPKRDLATSCAPSPESHSATIWKFTCCSPTRTASKPIRLPRSNSMPRLVPGEPTPTGILHCPSRCKSAATHTWIPAGRWSQHPEFLKAIFQVGRLPFGQLDHLPHGPLVGGIGKSKSSRSQEGQAKCSSRGAGEQVLCCAPGGRWCSAGGWRL